MRPLVRRSVAACDDQPLLKEVGLRVLRTLVKHVRPTLKPVQRVAALLSQVSSGGATLFPDWSPPAVGPSSAVALDLASCTASSRSTTTTHAPQQALKDGSECWVSTGGVDTSFWTAAVAGDVASLQAITLEGTSQLADTVEVFVTTAPRPPPGEPDMVWTSLGCVPGELLVREFTIPVKLQAQRIKLVFRGHHKKNTTKVHALKRVQLTRAKPSALHSKSSDVLASVERWLLSAASSSKDDICREAAFGALMKLALATGAVTAVMRVVQVALAAGDSPLSKQFAAEGHAFLVSVRDQFFDVCKETGPVGGAGGTRVMTDVVFAQDRAFHSNGLEFQEGGKVVRCTGGNEYAALDVPFSHGKGAWEFKLEHDTPNGECSCFGFVTLPVTSNNYEHSSSMWMYRCYNGNLYAKGVNLHRPLSKVHPGDTVRFELDMDSGTCTVSHNGGAPVQAFKDLAGLTVYPAIAFYSSSRSIRVLSVEVEGSAGASSDTRVARLSSTTDTVSKTSLVVGSTFPGTTTPLLLGNDTVTDAIMFDVHSKATAPKEGLNIVTIGAANLGADTFRSRVGVVRKPGDEWVLDQPILFSLLADDVEVWSTAVSSFDVATDVDVQLLPGVTELVMKVACESAVPAVLAVWDAPRLMNVPWWWEYKELEKANSPIVAAIKTPPTTFMDLGSRMLMQLQLYANEALRSMRNTAAPAAGDWAPPLERPFTLQVSPSTFEIILDLLRTLTPRAAQGDGSALSVATSVLRILTANIRRLVVSGLSPRELGFAACDPVHGASGESKGAEGEAESKDADSGTLAQLQQLLEGLAGDPGCEVADVDPTLSLEAGAVLDAGLPLFWRTVAQRQERVTKLLSPGGVMELHFTWPCNTGEDNEVDARFERTALLLHALCRRKKLRAATAGHWSGSLHVVVEIPEGSVETVLRDHLGSIMGLAGFDGWSFSEGCSSPHIQVRVERSATFDRALRLKTEAGVGWVRLYPKAVASFDQVCDSVDAYVAHHEAAAAALQASIEELKEKAAAKKAAKEAAAAAAAAPPA